MATPSGAEAGAPKLRLLFVCSRNQWRSPTAEDLFRNHPQIEARSAGTSPKARIRVNEKLLQWADMVLVMEKRHRDILRAQFPHLMPGRDIRVLNIPDDYQRNDPELLALLQDRMNEILI